MAIRQIRTKEDEILYKNCKEVKNFDEKLHILLDDMYDTLKKLNGVGLAAPQVGILKRAAVIDVGDGLIELINPEITEQSGSQIGSEGCLSVPDVWGEVEACCCPPTELMTSVVPSSWVIKNILSLLME